MPSTAGLARSPVASAGLLAYVRNDGWEQWKLDLNE